MSIPVECSEIQEFTPESLQEAMGDDAPVFRLKSPSERCVKRYRAECKRKRITSYSEEEMDDRRKVAIARYWDAEASRSYLEQFNTLRQKEKQGIALEPAEEQWLEKLERDIREVDDEFVEMEIKNDEFWDVAPAVAIAVYVEGWDRLNTPFKLSAGIIPDQTVIGLSKDLAKLASRHGVPEHKPLIELFMETTKLLRLDEDEEKNSPAPSPSSSSPEPSTATAQTDGASIEESSLDASSSSNLSPKKTPKAE